MPFRGSATGRAYICFAVLIALVATSSPRLPAEGGGTGIVLRFIDATPEPKRSDSEMALGYDIVTLQNWAANRVPSIKKLNRSVKALFYRAAHMTWDWQENWGEITAHESWFMHNSSGRRTRNSEPNDAWYLMDVRNSEFRAYQIRYIMKFVKTHDFDGVFWDGPPGAITGWLSLNPGPDRAAASTWHQDILTFLRELKQALGSKLLITNSTATYDSHVSGVDDTDYLQYVDGTMIEGFAHAPWDSAKATPGDPWAWQQRMAQRNISAGKYLFAHSGVQQEGASKSDIKRWQVFTLASFLLRADGKRAFYEWSEYGTDAQGILFPEMNLTIGTALGEATMRDGVYAREFSAGKVLVNASDSPRVVEVDAQFRPATGGTVPTMTLRPWTAAIFVK